MTKEHIQDYRVRKVKEELIMQKRKHLKANMILVLFAFLMMIFITRIIMVVVKCVVGG